MEENEQLQYVKVVYSKRSYSTVEQLDEFTGSASYGEVARGESWYVILSSGWLVVELRGREEHGVCFSCPIDRVIYTIFENVEYELK